MASYNNVERGASSAQSPTAKKIIVSSKLANEDKQRLRELSKIKVEKRIIKITEADRLAYQRRKNEKYAQEMKLPQKVRNKGIKVGYSKTAVQRIFY